MTIDFRAQQVQTRQIIASGSLAGGSGAKLVVYPIDAQPVGSPNQGLINQNAFNTGSLNGTDIFMYVSGAVGGKDGTGQGIAVFGGDVHISGTVTAFDGLGGGGSSPWIEATAADIYTTSSVAANSPGAAPSDSGFYVSGSINNRDPASADFKISNFNSDVKITGSFIAGSSGNTVSGTVDSPSIFATIVGGEDNFIGIVTGSGGEAGSADSAIIGGSFNNIFGSPNSLVAGGTNHVIQSNGVDQSEGNSIIGGDSSVISASNWSSLIGGGFFGSGNSIIGGTANYMMAGIQNSISSSGFLNGIIGGFDCHIIGTNPSGGGNLILAASDSAITGSSFTYVAGSGNIINETQTSQIFGVGTNATFTTSSFITGRGNEAHRVQRAVILAGTSNILVDSFGSAIIASSQFIVSGSDVEEPQYVFVAAGNQGIISGSLFSAVVAGEGFMTNCTQSLMAANATDKSSAAMWPKFVSTQQTAVVGTNNTNITSSLNSFVGGGTDFTSNTLINSAILGGDGHLANAVNKVGIIGGTDHVVSSSNQTVVAGGSSAFVQGVANGFIGGGSDAQLVGTNATNSAVIAGITCNVSESATSVIAGGNFNRILATSQNASSNNVIFGGDTNTIGVGSVGSGILVGSTNVLSESTTSAIVASGDSNMMNSSELSAIMASDSCEVNGSYNGGVIGSFNCDIFTLSDNCWTIGSDTSNQTNNYLCGIFAAGSSNVIDSSNSGIFASDSNELQNGDYSGIFACQDNVLSSSDKSSIQSSEQCEVRLSDWSSAIASFDSVISSSFRSVSIASDDGLLNDTNGSALVASNFSSIFGPSFKCAAIGTDFGVIKEANYSAIIGGTVNTLSGSEYSYIIGGFTNSLLDEVALTYNGNMILNGRNNVLSHSLNTTILGSRWNIQDEANVIAIGGNTSGFSENEYRVVVSASRGMHIHSGSLVAYDGLSGSLQSLSDGSPYMLAGPNITIVTNSLGQVEITGSVTAPTVTIVSTDYTILGTDSFLAADSTSNVITGTLPSSPVNGFSLTVKDVLGTSAANNIILSSSTTAQIDGSSTYAMAINYISTTLTYVSGPTIGDTWSIT